jgi:thiol:disulfide interchange protein
MQRIIKAASFWVLALAVYCAPAQVLKPIKWEVSIVPTSFTKNDTVEVQFSANIDADWYLYSSDFDPELGPMVTRFTFEPHASYSLIGEIVPVHPKRKYDSLWEGEYTYFVGHALFTQKVVVLSDEYQISGNYSYQVCTDVDGKCIPFEDDFSLEKKKEVTTEQKSETNKVSLLNEKSSNDPYTLLSFMLVAFLAGLTALLTPCVFPMIPMTVSFFTGKNKTRAQAIFQSAFYGFSIILIYVIIGAVIAPFMGPETANELATGWIPNVIFFTVFVLFALSFFGLFEITLPYKWVNKMDRMGDSGGLVGIFFMAMTLVLVSFSCTGPIVGSILVESAGGLFLKPILGMFAFSVAFALPFALFAMFPGWLQSLPKSGGWLNSVKVVLGFLELALAFKFLSIADQAYHWGILDRDIYLIIWIIIFAMLGLYLVGKIRLKGDSIAQHLSVGRLILSMITFGFVLYLIPGLFGAPLKALAGYLPPLSTHDFNLMAPEEQAPLCEEPLYTEKLDWPLGLNGYFDYQQALACAKAVGKPIFVDFTGHGCVNCREMEQRVWANPEVLKRLKEDFVLLALYVDDKTELPESLWYESPYDGKIKKTIGKQNADFQIRNFDNNAQPFYLILGKSGQPLNGSHAYNLNAQAFTSFLDEGKSKF